MTAKNAAEARIVHVIPGRVRIHLGGWSRNDKGLIEARLRSLAGVRSAQADPLTGNVLMHFDPQLTNEYTLLAALQPPPAPAPAPSADVLPFPQSPQPGQQPAAQSPWWDLAKLLLLVAELVTGAFALEEIGFVLSGAETILQLRQVLAPRAA
jgi:hypothetical protein